RRSRSTSRCWSGLVWSDGVDEPSTDLAPSKPHDSKRSRPGPSATVRSGRPASTRWTATSQQFSGDKGRRSKMTDNIASENAVVIERSFDAPISLIWKMWTDAEHFKAWYGPNGATIPVANMDVRVGGARLVCMEMQSPDGPMQMWFAGEYREVVENERLVYTESMSDENGNVLSPSDMGIPEGHPTTTEVSVELEYIGGRTKMVMTHAGIPADSPGAAGWAMAFDKLAAHVKAHSGG